MIILQILIIIFIICSVIWGLYTLYAICSNCDIILHAMRTDFPIFKMLLALSLLIVFSVIL